MKNEEQFLIVGGTTKAATTSMFSYLADHPEVDAASYKETRFFLDEEYPLPRKYMFTEKLEDYLLFFKKNSAQKIHMEATPDYLYSEKTPERLQKMFGTNVKIVFILRNPIDRMNSWYRFAKQIGEIDDISFMEFIHLQKSANEGKQIERVLAQGKYSTFLKPFFDWLGKEQVKVIFYENFQEDEKKAMKELAAFAGINSGFYNDYSFDRKNVTVEVKQNVLSKLFMFYQRMRWVITLYTHNKGFHKYLRVINKKLENLYYKNNSKLKGDQQPDPEVIKFLTEYYQQEAKFLGELLQVKVPW